MSISSWRPRDGASGDLPARGREEDARLRDALDEAHRQIDALRAQVEEMTARHESLMRHSNDVTVVTAEDTTMTYASPALAQVLGQGTRSGRGRRLVDLAHPEDRGACSRRPARSSPAAASARSAPGSGTTMDTTGTSPRCSRTRAATTPWAAWCGTCAT